MNKLLSILLLPVLLAACSSTPPVSNSPVTNAQPAPARTLSAETRHVPETNKPLASELNDPSSPLANRSVYFPYDEFIIAPKFDQLLGAHAGYLARNPNSRLTVEGNADERGSTEYNLALGQKRAEAVRKSLMLRGVADKQMEAISYGKERPRATCHDESCWQANRRADIVYPAVR